MTKKRLCVLSDFNIFEENSDSPYVPWSEVMEVLPNKDYRELIKYLSWLKIHLRREWVDTKYLKEFLDKIN